MTERPTKKQATPTSSEAPARVRDLDHLVLTVRDPRAALDFYCRLLGMEEITFDGGRQALRFGRRKINLHPLQGAPELRAAVPAPGSADLCFLIDRLVDEAAIELEIAGARVVAGPGPRAGGRGPLRSIYLRDPDGNLVELANEVKAGG